MGINAGMKHKAGTWSPSEYCLLVVNQLWKDIICHTLIYKISGSSAVTMDCQA